RDGFGGGVARGVTPERPGQAHLGSPALSLLGQALVELGDLVHVAPAEGGFEIDDLVVPPVEVVGDVRDFLVDAVGRVRHDPPRRSPPDTSTVNACWQAGQVSSARVWPSWLTRRYRSCRNARSEAKRCSMTQSVTSTSPSLVMTRASS